MTIRSSNRSPLWLLSAAVAALAMTATAAVAAPLLSQDFNTSVTSGGWTVANYDGGPVTWKLNSNFGESNWTGGDGTAAMMDSFSYYQESYDAALLSPTIALPQTSQDIVLSFLTTFEPWSGDETADVDVSVNGGGWTNLLRWSDLAMAVDGPQAVSLTDYAGQNVQLRFRYYNPQSAAWDNYWQIDDVLVDLVGTTPLVGDYNGNGNVDIDDYSLWVDSFGQTGPNLPADGNNNGQIDIADYTLWADNFGASLGGLVPEPASLTLLTLLTGVLFKRRR